MSFNLPTVEAKVEFIRDLPLYQSEKPYYVAGPLDPADEHLRTNARFEKKYVKFHDLRGHENMFSLKQHGFEFIVNSDASTGTLHNLTEHNVEAYARDTVQLLKGLFGTDHCWCYSYKFRSSADFNRPPGVPTGDRRLPDEPATKAHIDHTLEGGFRRIRRHLTIPEQKVFVDSKQPHWRLLIVNTWRPLNGPVMDYPLAVCDPATVSVPNDGFATDRVGPDFQGENYYLKHRDAHKWYWLSNQRVDELLLFISFDSEGDTERSCKY
ncbi:hypothetical protein F5Y04DRAFT_290464 [Hypomontagnella monticulosa]|nr:hypothetical protein F5Y04DRAFT_290464 [Hypomontagnella monticulosa]